ncbi:hypothetical protein D3C78_714090 [compost metagenome]
MQALVSGSQVLIQVLVAARQQERIDFPLGERLPKRGKSLSVHAHALRQARRMRISASGTKYSMGPAAAKIASTTSIPVQT